MDWKILLIPSVPPPIAPGLAAVAVRSPWARCYSASAPVQQQLQATACPAQSINKAVSSQILAIIIQIITEIWSQISARQYHRIMLTDLKKTIIRQQK
jgi:hypothetical protein